MSQPVVIDNGTGMIKAGFAGSDKPRVVIRSYVGRTKHQRVMPGGALEGNEIFIGNKADEHRGALTLSYPIEHGVVQNWQDMVMKLFFYKNLETFIECRPNNNSSYFRKAYFTTSTRKKILMSQVKIMP